MAIQDIVARLFQRPHRAGRGLKESQSWQTLIHGTRVRVPRNEAVHRPKTGPWEQTLRRDN